MIEPEVRTYQVAEQDERPRLDAYLAARDAGWTRAQVQRLIEAGDVTVNGALPAKAGVKVRAGDTIAVTIRPAVAVDLVPEAMSLAVLHEDRHLIVIDKPAGLVVHPAPGHGSGTLVHGLLAHVDDLGGIGGELRPGIVHRLDKDTSGVMVVAKDEPTLNALASAFKVKTEITREYLAICAPAPALDSGTLRTLYNRHPVDRKRFSSKVQVGKVAVTHWRVIERLAFGAALIRCRLETGRTHQIRVHMADSGAPLVGDPVYGRRYGGPLGELSRTLARQALHAARLEFTHPSTGEVLRFETPPPADFAALHAALRSAMAGGHLADD